MPARNNRNLTCEDDVARPFPYPTTPQPAAGGWRSLVDADSGTAREVLIRAALNKGVGRGPGAVGGGAVGAPARRALGAAAVELPRPAGVGGEGGAVGAFALLVLGAAGGINR